MQGGCVFNFPSRYNKSFLIWALPLNKSVAVWAPKTQVPHTDGLKPILRKSFVVTREGNSEKHHLLSFDFLYSNAPAPFINAPGKKEVHLSRDKLNFFFNFGIFYGSPFVQNCCISVCTQLPVPPFSLV